MSHFDIIIITVTLFISSTAGVYVAVRYTNLLTRPPVNTLTRRSGDIELQYIEPSTNNNLDLLQPQQVYTSNINSCLENSINLESTPSYLSGNPPSYNTLDLLQQVYIPSYQNTSYIPTCQNTSYIPSYQNTSFTNYCSEDTRNSL
jgi:hypothetical protein